MTDRIHSTKTTLPEGYRFGDGGSSFDSPVEKSLAAALLDHIDRRIQADLVKQRHYFMEKRGK